LEGIDNLIKALDAYLDGRLPVEGIEDATTPFLIDDENKLEDESLSRIIYLLDMHEIEELTREDIAGLRDELIAHKNKRTK